MHRLIAILVVFQTLADRVPLDDEASSVLQSFSSKTGQHDQHSDAAAAANGLSLDQFRLRLLSEYDVSKQTDMAIVTHICDTHWAPGAMALAASLKKAGTNHNLVIMLTSDFDKRYHRLFAHLFDKVYVEEPVKEHPSIIRAGADCLTLQLRAWQLPYRKVLYMDADMIALKSHDPMLEESGELTARPDQDVPKEFNGGMMVLEPSESTFEKLKAAMAAFQNPGIRGGMQYFLNHAFPPCEQPSEKDVGCWKGKLSDEYNKYTRQISVYHFDSEINSKKYFSLHYSGDWGRPRKPWMSQCLDKSESVTFAGTDLQSKLLTLWMDTFHSVSVPADLADLVHTECEFDKANH